MLREPLRITHQRARYRIPRQRSSIVGATAAALAISACGGIDASGGVTGEPPDLAIANVSVVDVDVGTVLAGRTVTIRAGRIESIDADPDEPAAEVIDGTAASSSRVSGIRTFIFGAGRS